MEKQSVNDYIKFEATTNTLSMMTVAILLKVRHVVRRSMHFDTTYKTIQGSTYITNIEPDKDKSETTRVFDVNKEKWCTAIVFKPFDFEIALWGKRKKNGL